ncbi:hypothetical protein WK41_19295 [Burkholderia cepacia]|nr:hypothetical protein WK41_19295 [Burkholderia cepacia]
MPSLPIEHGIALPSLQADIAVSKFADHQSLYRQSEIAARDGATLDRGSMGRWIGQIAEICVPLVADRRPTFGVQFKIRWKSTAGRPIFM